MAARKVLTRAESQAQTRDNLIDAAEELFLRDGYYATSIAAIAAEAGRTIGAVYSNFDNKESLCLEVLRRRSSAELARLMSDLMAAPAGLDARLVVISTWWARLSSEVALSTLFAEYALSVLRDPEQHARTRETAMKIVESGRTLFEDFAPEGVEASGPQMDRAVVALIAMGTGLAAGRAADVVTAEQSATILSDSIRMWFREIGESVLANTES
ncbi:helix-turn-helix domain-containing protein [Nocardia sp. NPDC005978]|uniref:TetR/AcrR family transcriptional regulator n=1 Tax=unclassified Nocardia TaxID=2637762 RepID=UPI0033BBFD34